MNVVFDSVYSPWDPGTSFKPEALSYPPADLEISQAVDDGMTL